MGTGQQAVLLYSWPDAGSASHCWMSRELCQVLAGTGMLCEASMVRVQGCLLSAVCPSLLGSEGAEALLGLGQELGTPSPLACVAQSPALQANPWASSAWIPSLSRSPGLDASLAVRTPAEPAPPTAVPWQPVLMLRWTCSCKMGTLLSFWRGPESASEGNWEA